MKRVLCFLFVTLFFVSVASGEKLCCSSKATSQNNVTVSSLNYQHADLDQNTHTEQDSHESHHQCLGCSHSPVFNRAPVLLAKYEFVLKHNFIDIDNRVSHPFLDGPFQPPKA